MPSKNKARLPKQIPPETRDRGRADRFASRTFGRAQGPRPYILRCSYAVVFRALPDPLPEFLGKGDKIGKADFPIAIEIVARIESFIIR